MMTPMRKICSGLLLSVIVALSACGSSDSPASTTTVATRSIGSSNATIDLLQSACFTHMSRADVRVELVAMGKTPVQVENDLQIFDDLC